MKRPYLQYSVPSLEVFIDERGWLPSFNRIFYELPFPEFPFKFPGKGFFVANGWSNGEGTFTQKIKILGPDHQTVIVDSGSKTFELKNADIAFVGVNFLQEVQFEKPGIYWIQVLLNEELLLEYPMTVRLREGAEDKGKAAAPAAVAEKTSAPAAAASAAPAAPAAPTAHAAPAAPTAHAAPAAHPVAEKPPAPAAPPKPPAPAAPPKPSAPAVAEKPPEVKAPSPSIPLQQIDSAGMIGLTPDIPKASEPGGIKLGPPDDDMGFISPG